MLRGLLRSIVKIITIVIAVQFVVVATGFFIASNSVSDTFSELLLIVAEDNCLDDTVDYNGSTTARKFKSKLDTINSTQGMVNYSNNAVEVQYTSRDTAPQKGSLINCKLTGTYKAKFNLFGGMEVEIPIPRETKVLGTKYYRDR